MKASPLSEHHNRTGIASAKDRAETMIEGAAKAEPSSKDSSRFVQTHKEYIEHADWSGTMPPSSGKEKAPALLLDKLGERLAFERTGVRLYDGLLLKLQAEGSFDGGPSKKDLERIRLQELQHFGLLENTIRELGGDPTAVTPSANLAGVEAAGMSGVVGDPRVSLPDALHALLIAELADNAGWEQLIDLCGHAGHNKLVERFERCQDEEREHLRSVRSWLDARANADLGLAAT